LLIVLAIALVLAVIASVVVVTLTNVAAQQRKESLALLKDQRLAALVEARGKIQPATNAYLAAYKKARNLPASQEEAEKNSAKERDDFQQAISSARTALNEVQSGNGGGEADEIAVAVTQLGDSYQAYMDSMEGLVESYPRFEGLFRQDAGCSGLFVGSKASNLRERQTLLSQAAGTCREAVNQLKQSKNISYVEFARTLDNEIAQLETHAETTAKSEENYNEFVRLKDEYQKKVDDATARNASDEEYRKITEELKALNTRIKNNRSEFDFAAKRYLTGVKDMPTLVDDVFSKNIAEQLKHHDAVIPIRVQVVKDEVDAELAE